MFCGQRLVEFKFQDDPWKPFFKMAARNIYCPTSCFFLLIFWVIRVIKPSGFFLNTWFCGQEFASLSVCLMFAKTVLSVKKFVSVLVKTWSELPEAAEKSNQKQRKVELHARKKPNYSFLIIFLWFWQSMVTKMLRLSCICRKFVLLAYTWSDRLFCLFRHGFTTYSTQIRIKRTWIEITSITKNRVAEARTYCSCPNAPYE